MTTSAEPRHWLMKSEPDVFGIDDLRRVHREPWSGVRNFQARNFMRDEMKKGDHVLFYHSSVTPPGVAGLARVACAAYPDPTQFDPKSEYFDAKATEEAPRWYLVDVEFVKRFGRLVTLETLREEPALKGMALLKKGQRLSIQPVAPEHYRQVLAMSR